MQRRGDSDRINDPRFDLLPYACLKTGNSDGIQQVDIPKEQHDLLRELAAGEDSTRQFKRDVRNAQSLAVEIAAFANSEGGVIYIGVEDDGRAVGLDSAGVARLNQLISNAASHLVRCPLTVRTNNVLLDGGTVVMVLTVPKGLDKPYFDNSGVIWLKSGADKRRVNSKEELRRFFQVTDQFHADELPTEATPRDIDMDRFGSFLRDAYDLDVPLDRRQLLTLLRNLNLASDSGALNLAGLLLLGTSPQRYKPQFVLKAIRYPGIEIHPSTYLDTEDCEGSLRAIFDDALAFVLRNLRKVQGGGGVNAPGTVEIPPAVFEELLVNALVHRDYLVSAPVRLFLYDDRIEIVSPGHLPNNLTVENIRAGISNIRNPILVSVASKGLLPYHGLGSGIKRALAVWPEIDFVDDRDRNQFAAIVRRVTAEATEVTDHINGQVDRINDPLNDLINLLRRTPDARYNQLAARLRVSEATVSDTFGG